MGDTRILDGLCRSNHIQNINNDILDLAFSRDISFLVLGITDSKRSLAKYPMFTYLDFKKAPYANISDFL